MILFMRDCFTLGTFHCSFRGLKHGVPCPVALVTNEFRTTRNTGNTGGTGSTGDTGATGETGEAGHIVCICDITSQMARNCSDVL